MYARDVGKRRLLRDKRFSKKVSAFMRNRIFFKTLSSSYLLHIFILKCNQIH